MRQRRRGRSTIYTKRNTCRATKYLDDCDDDDDKQEIMPFGFELTGYTTTHTSRSEKIKNLVKRSEGSTKSFPFMRLPPEIREMVYYHVVIPKSHYPILLNDDIYFRPGGIETAILSTNRNVCSTIFRFPPDRVSL